jgi:hypothetical protein
MASASFFGNARGVYFRNAIQDETSTPPVPKIRTHRNNKKARDLLMEAVKNETSVSNPKATLTVLKAFRQILISDLVMACIPVDSERDAFRIFETLNDRGLRLSVPDLLLNYLMRQANPESDRKQIRDLWTEMVERMGRRDINRFLRHMWVSKYGDLKSQDLFTALKEHIEKNKISSLDFARACADECEYYVQIVTIDNESLKEAGPYVHSLLRDLNADSSLPLLLSAFQKFSIQDFTNVCRWLLVFVMRYSVIESLDTSGLETVFFDLARTIRIKVPQKSDKPSPDAKACLRDIKNTLIREAPSDDKIRLGVKDLILSPDDAGYVMSRLATRMQTGTKEVTVNVNEANLEHIFPKNPAEKEWGGKRNQEILEPYLWHIGNLTILGQRLNREAANKEYSIKKEHYAKKSELVMAQNIASGYKKWNEASIKDRADKLTDLVLEVWDFNNPSRV